MIKVLIVVSGLVMFVPDSGLDPLGMTALLLETQYASMPLHIPAVRQQIDIVSFRTWPLQNGDFEATFKVGKNGNETINLNAQKDFPQLTDLTDMPDDAKIDSQCLTLTGTKCRDENGKKRVAAIVHFKGNWRTRPLQRCAKEWHLPVDFSEGALSDFRKSSGLETPKPGNARPLATGLALEADIEKLTDLVVNVNGAPSNLQLSDPDMCKAWLGSSVPACVVLEVENWPTIADVPKCEGEMPPADCRVDLHFSMYYNLIQKHPVSEPWLPYVATGTLMCQGAPGPGHPPGIRCPQTFALPN